MPKRVCLDLPSGKTFAAKFLGSERSVQVANGTRGTVLHGNSEFAAVRFDGHKFEVVVPRTVLKPFDGANVHVGCSVGQLAADLLELPDQENMVMVEIDGTSRQIRGVRNAVIKVPDGTEINVILLVGHGETRRGEVFQSGYASQ